jgi:hypothetical protein
LNNRQKEKEIKFERERERRSFVNLFL